MKRNLNPELPVEMAVNTDFQTQPLIVSGDYDVLMPLAEQLQALDARTPRVSRVSKPVGQVAVMEAPSVLEGRRASVAAKLYDLANRSSMYDLLKQKRQEEKDLAMAKKLGLISTDRCAKHEKQLATVRGLS